MPLNEQDLKLLTTVKSNDVNAVKALLSDKKDEKDSKAVTADVNCALLHDDKELSCCTPLHIAVHNRNPDMVKLLLEHGAKTYLVDKDFKTPIQRATEARIEEVSLLLLRHRTPIDLEHIENALEIVRGSYVGQDEKMDRQALIDYAASYLAGENVDALLRADGNYHKYLGHLKDLEGSAPLFTNDGKHSEGPRLEFKGWEQKKFIPLRIQSFLKIILEIDRGRIPDLLLRGSKNLNNPKTKKDYLDVLYQELIILANMKHVWHALDAICIFPSVKRNAAQLALAQNISKQLEDDKSLPVGQEFSFAGGWYRHAVYVNFVKSKDRRLFVRIDNLGDGFPVSYKITDTQIKLRWPATKWINGKEEIDYDYKDFACHGRYTGASTDWISLHTPLSHDKRHIRKSCVIGAFNLEAKEEKNKIVQYVEGIIAEKICGVTTHKPDSTTEDDKLYERMKMQALPKYYDFTHFIPGQFTKDLADGPKLPFLEIQKVGNCTVKNCMAGLEIRMNRLGWDNNYYRRLLGTEVGIAGPNPIGKPVDIAHLWSLLAELPRIPRPDSMKAAIQEYYKEEKQALVTRLFSNETMPIDKCYINLSLIPHTTKDNSEYYANIKKEIEKNIDTKRDAQLSINDEIYAYDSKETKELSNILQAHEDKRVLIIGRAGIGKSTLCQYIAHQWAMNKLKLLPRNDFNLIIWIRLRHLNNTVRYPVDGNYSYLDIVRKECHALLGYEMPNELLEQQLKEHRVLWLLDGYDELPLHLREHSNSGSDHKADEKGTLKAAVKELFANPKNLIITSRPSAIPPSGEYERLELVGFTDANIEEYIELFFNPKKAIAQVEVKKNLDRKLDEKTPLEEKINPKTKALITRLQSNPNLASLAHIPILLELMCCLAQSNSASLNTISAMTTLYRESLRWLLQRVIDKDKININGETLESYYKEELIALEMLAFKADGNPILGKELINEVLDLIFPSKREKEKIIFLQKLWATGFLRTLPGSINLLERDGVFLHLTFQEFFAARYILRQLKNPTQPDYQKALQWVTHYKYYNQNDISISFLAGLLSESESVPKEAVTDFWKALHAAPRDLVGIRHLKLVMRCLEETCENSLVLDQRVWEKNIQECFAKNLPQKDAVAGVIIQHLTQVFKQSPKIFNRTAKNILCDALKRDGQQLQAVELLGEIGPVAAIPEILEVFKPLLNHADFSIRFNVIVGLGLMGRKAIEFFVKTFPAFDEVISKFNFLKPKLNFIGSIYLSSDAKEADSLLTDFVKAVENVGLSKKNSIRLSAVKKIYELIRIAISDRDDRSKRPDLIPIPFRENVFIILMHLAIDHDAKIREIAKKSLALLPLTFPNFNKHYFKALNDSFENNNDYERIKNRKYLNSDPFSQFLYVTELLEITVTEKDLIKMVKSDDISAKTKVAAIRTLCHRGVSPIAFRAIIKAITEDKESEVRKNALLAVYHLIRRLGGKLLTSKTQKNLIAALRDSEKDIKHCAITVISQLFPISEIYKQMFVIMQKTPVQDIISEYQIEDDESELNQTKKVLIWTYSLLLQGGAITITQQDVHIYDAQGTESIGFELDKNGENAVRHFFGTIIQIFASHAKQYGLPTDIYRRDLSKLALPALPNISLLRAVAFDRMEDRLEENPVYVKGLADNLRSLGIFSITPNAGIIDEKITISPLMQASLLRAKVQVDATSETALSIVKQFLY